MKTNDEFVIVAIAAMIGVSALLYPALPDLVATYWTNTEVPIIFVHKYLALIAIPFSAAILYLVHQVLLRIYVVGSSRTYLAWYKGILNFLVVYLFVLHTALLLWSTPFRVTLLQIMCFIWGSSIFIFGEYIFTHPKKFPRYQHVFRSKKSKGFIHRLIIIAGVATLCGVFFRFASLFFLIAPSVIGMILAGLYVQNK